MRINFFIQQLFNFFRVLFKKTCPECGSALSNDVRLDYVAAYGEDPPYNGSFEIRTLTCPDCLYTFRKVKIIPLIA